MVRQLHQFVMQTVIEHPRQLLWRVSAGEIGTAHVTDKEGVTGQHGPGPLLLVIGDHEADALEGVSRSFENTDLGVAELQFEAIVDGHVLECGPRLGAEIYFCPSAGGEFLVS